MGSKHQTTLLDRARDELFSHVIRCDVLEAHMDDRAEWLADTMDFMAHRYPQLGELELAQLEVMGKRFIKPAIPHGADTTATNRKKWQKATPVVDPAVSAEGPAEAETEAETATAAETATEDEVAEAAEPQLATAAAS
ncbi:MAG: hypothetical protein HKN72_09285 [Gemmatimonadetes bacterium]|nr:hypothetical protein [Gemmatimonadota bacterium]